jgi:hypothetical protein
MRASVQGATLLYEGYCAGTDRSKFERLDEQYADCKLQDKGSWGRARFPAARPEVNFYKRCEDLCNQCKRCAWVSASYTLRVRQQELNPYHIKYWITCTTHLQFVNVTHLCFDSMEKITGLLMVCSVPTAHAAACAEWLLHLAGQE